jgi:hypothetical protein
MTEALTQAEIDVRPPHRIGVILGDIGRLNVTVLKYLVLHLNTLQQTFEFEFVDLRYSEPLIVTLAHETVVDREKCRAVTPAFHERVLKHIAAVQAGYNLSDRTVAEQVVLITMSRFHDNYYSLREGPVQVMALGAWDRHMAPPSIYEFIITLLMRQAVGFAAPWFAKSIHFGTKGCLFDFTPGLYDARYKSLQGYICSTCRERLEHDGLGHTANELVHVLQMKWLGKVDNPLDPAGIAAKLGFNLFLTKGIVPTFWENVRTQLRDEGTKEFVKLIGGIILAALLVWLGLKTSGS